ncbi:hypothetical protein NQ317_016202 [Molorchus minor]|uniref:C2H2-type domain-containing protein n=1 Tax=Molorchus minor TaxID=1323400 RepID=A0ABQ9J7C6_9CUCU|nr:hypothetical protein NQ317_016202 [Molorchus minor]
MEVTDVTVEHPDPERYTNASCVLSPPNTNSTSTNTDYVTKIILKLRCTDVRSVSLRRCTKESMKQHQLVHKDDSEVQMHKCDNCNYQTKHPTSLRRHVMIHKDSSEVKTFQCEVCEFKTKYRNNMARHQLIHKNALEGKASKCNNCRYSTKYKNLPNMQCTIHKATSEVKMYECDLCKFKSRFVNLLYMEPLACLPCIRCIADCFNLKKTCKATEKSIKRYSEKVETSGQGQVNLNDVLTFLNQEPLKCENIDNQVTIKEEPTPCEIYLNHCDYEGVNKEAPELENEVPAPVLDGSIQKKTEAKLYECELCPFKTKYKININRHALVHNNCEIYNCDSCKFKTKHKNSFIRHKICIHKQKDLQKVRIFKCGICPFDSAEKDSLKTHTLNHKDGSDMFKCDICEYKSERKGHLIRHLLVHKSISEVRIFKCELCTYESKRMENLNTHRLVHKDRSEIEMFKCETCGYETRHKFYIRRHVMHHKKESEVKMYKCDTCGYKTLRPSNLKKHLLVHLKWFRCHLCDYKTKQKAHLVDHIVIHEGNFKPELYSCDVCEFKTKHKYYLRKHQVVHKDSSEVRMYICETCSYKTKYRGGFKRHILCHRKGGTNLDISEEPVMCKSCAELVQNAFNFKSISISVEKRIKSFTITNATMLDLKEIYKNENNEADVLTKKTICRFCMKCVEDGNAASLDALKMKQVLPEEMLQKVLPELDYTFIREPMVCPSCVGSLTSYFSIAATCETTEEKVNHYCEQHGTNSKGLIQLIDVHRSVCEDFPEFKLAFNQIVIKKEEPVTDDIKSNYTELDVKKEPTDETDDTCNLEESQEIQVKVHIGIPEPNTYKCELCKFTTRNKRLFKRHHLTHKNDSEIKTYKCDICDFRAKRPGSLKSHLTTHTDSLDNDFYKCQVCEYRTKNTHILKKHITEHDNNSEPTIFLFTKTSLKRRYTSAISANSRLNVNVASRTICRSIKKPTEIEMYQCEVCHFKTKYRENFRKHELVHKDDSEVETYQCESCDFRTKYKSSIKLHLLVHNDSIDTSMYTCKIGDRTLQAEDESPDKDCPDVEIFKCDICKFHTKYKTNLSKHLITHKKNEADLRMFKCDLCPFQTIHKRNLKEHILVHKDGFDAELFGCDKCEFKTKHKGSLTRHMLAHKDSSEVKMYTCELCVYKTKHKGNIKRHLLMHNDSQG